MTYTKEQIRAALADDTIVADGHGLYHAEHYAPHFDVEAMGLVHTHRSDGTFKGQIFTDGVPVDELRAVYNLEFLEHLNRELGLPGASALGRGFRASELVRSITTWALPEEAAS